MTGSDESAGEGPHGALIRRLAADLQPVRRALSPVSMTIVFLAAAVAAGVLTGMTSRPVPGQRPFGASIMLDWLFIAPALTTVSAALAAFELSFPDRTRAWVLVPAPAILLWIAAIVWEMVSPSGSLFGTSWREVLQCFRCIALSATPLVVLVLWMLRQANPLEPGLTALIGGIACAAAGAAILAFVHPHSSTPLDHAAHATAIAIVILLCWMIGRRVLAVSR